MRPIKSLLAQKRRFGNNRGMVGRLVTSLGFSLVLGVTSFPVWGDAMEDWQYYSSYDKKSAAWEQFIEEGFRVYDTGDCLMATNLLLQAVAAGSRSPLVMVKLALCYEHQGSTYSAIQHYELAKEYFTNMPDHPYKRLINQSIGRIYYLANEKAKALPYLQQALLDGARDYWMLKILLKDAQDRADQQQVLQYLQLIGDQPPPDIPVADLANAYVMLARSALRANNQELATRYYQKVNKLDPNNHEANRYLMLLKQGGQMDELLKLLEFE